MFKISCGAAGISAFFAALAISLFADMPPASAETLRQKSEMDVYFGILPVGTATFDLQFDEKQYSITISGKTTGVAEMVAPGRGKTRSVGIIDDGRVLPAHHSVEFDDQSKKEKATLDMDIVDGAVTNVVLVPDKRKPKRGKKWVQISPDQLLSVIDPASTVVVPVEAKSADDPHAVCNRRLQVYDGDTRFDIQLSYKETNRVSTEGFKGDAFVCKLRYVPVSGHKLGRRNVEYMSANEGMEIWLARVGESNMYMPIRVEVPTWVGNFSAVPRMFAPARAKPVLASAQNGVSLND